MRLSVVLVTVLAGVPAGWVSAAGPAVWRCGWTSMAKPAETIDCAREIGFNALVFHGPIERMKQWSAMTKAAGIESYYWFSPIIHGDDADLAPFAQVMSGEDEAAHRKLQADKDPKKGGYQFGGEPLPARRDPRSSDHDVLLDVRLLCFHRPESIAWCKRQISEMLLACPDLTGVGLDFFGYQNYRCCLCLHSRQLLDAYRRRHPQ